MGSWTFDVEGLWNTLTTAGVAFLWKILVFLSILLIGFWITGIVERKLLKQRKLALVNSTFQSFFRSFVRIGMRIGVIVIAVRSIGVDNGTIIAVIGSAGLAIGLALQGSLSNLASGVLILTNKPFAVDDYIEFGTSSGTCVSIGLFYTRLKTPDGKAIYVPNSTITTTTLTNYSLYPERRMDIQIGVDYSTDFKTCKAALLQFADRHPKILKDPAPIVAIVDFAAYSLVVRFRFYVKSELYWDLYHEIYDEILDELNRQQVSIPFPRYVLEDYKPHHLEKESEI
ncbi:MAG: mechanosensitive ion channel family protein [Bacillota bacterium]|nr:mechanosensitive ion channel family protein [Bacillota bacterium]